MTIEIDFSDTDLDESPNTIAYALLALMSAAFDVEIAVEESFGDDIIVIRDDSNRYEYIRLRVSPMMGSLLLAILTGTGEELAATTPTKSMPWTSNQS